MLGHNHPAVVEAITEQAQKGLHYSACHELEVRWAELIRSVRAGRREGALHHDRHRDDLPGHPGGPRVHRP